MTNNGNSAVENAFPTLYTFFTAIVETIACWMIIFLRSDPGRTSFIAVVILIWQLFSEINPAWRLKVPGMVNLYLASFYFMKISLKNLIFCQVADYSVWSLFRWVSIYVSKSESAGIWDPHRVWGFGWMMSTPAYGSIFKWAPTIPDF